MPQLYDNSDQETLHLKAMQALASETGHDFTLVKRVYEFELSRLRADAHITDYVALLSSRRARERLGRAKQVASAPASS